MNNNTIIVPGTPISFSDQILTWYPNTPPKTDKSVFFNTRPRVAEIQNKSNKLCLKAFAKGMIATLKSNLKPQINKNPTIKKEATPNRSLIKMLDISAPRNPVRFSISARLPIFERLNESILSESAVHENKNDTKAKNK